MSGKLVGGAQMNVIQLRLAWFPGLGTRLAEAGDGGACSLGPGERRAAEARAHGQQRPGEEESETRHKTINL